METQHCYHLQNNGQVSVHIRKCENKKRALEVLLIIHLPKKCSLNYH